MPLPTAIACHCLPAIGVINVMPLVAYHWLGTQCIDWLPLVACRSTMHSVLHCLPPLPVCHSTFPVGLAVSLRNPEYIRVTLPLSSLDDPLPAKLLPAGAGSGVHRPLFCSLIRLFCILFRPLVLLASRLDSRIGGPPRDLGPPRKLDHRTGALAPPGTSAAQPAVPGTCGPWAAFSR